MSKLFKRYFTEAEEKRLFATVRQFSDIHARRDHAWMRLLRQTGIRVETMAGLNVGDARSALFSKHLLLRPEITKNNKGGELQLNKTARGALKDLLGLRLEMGHSNSPDSPLVYSRKNKRMSIRSYQARTRHWCDLAGIDGGSPHWFRHTLAKRIMQHSTARDPRGIVQIHLGHESINTTLIYTQPDKEDILLALEEAS